MRLRRFLGEHEGIVLPLTSLIVFLAAWQLVVGTGLVSGFFFSSPLGVINAGTEQVQSPAFWNDVRISATEFLVGYSAAVVVAVPFGLVSGWYRRIGYAVEPWVNGLNATPRLALLPLVVLWVGVGEPATTVIVFIGVFFPVAINAFYGVRTVERGLLSVAQSFGASEFTKFRTLILPSMVPFVLAGARLGIGRGVIGVVIGEFYSSTDGLGNFIFVSGATLAVDNILFGALFITALALTAFTALGRFESRFQAWRPKVEIGT